MESDTNTKNKTSRRWLRLSTPSTELIELNQILDYYWGGSERRLTGLTLRIIGVNVLALIMLMLGIVFLGQYQNRITESHLENFGIELELVTTAVSEAIEQASHPGFANYDAAQSTAKGMSELLKQNIFIYNQNGQRITQYLYQEQTPDRGFQSIEVLKAMARAILNMLPDQQTFKTYPSSDFSKAQNHPDARSAFEGKISLSVWEDEEENLVLSAASPIISQNAIQGIVLMTRDAQDIERDINQVWLDVLRILGLTSILTVLLSIYLSGVIARPLKRLAQSAENVRKGKATADDIPDMSHRMDEIGELSIVLKQMTHALWDRMDTIERFAADVAHELKNPLTSLKSAVETAQIVKKKQDREKLMEIIRHDIERLDRLITDISSASRLDSELSREEFEKINLMNLMHDTLDIYKDPLTREKTQRHRWDGHAIQNDIEIKLSSNTHKPLYIWGIQSRLLQVFHNILTNALSFSKPGDTIKIDIVSEKQNIAIIIEDEGPGIPENKLDTIFERFYSERPKHEDYGQHSGLGLSICKQIMQAHSAKLKAENNKDRNGKITGARFTLRFKKA